MYEICGANTASVLSKYHSGKNECSRGVIVVNPLMLHSNAFFVHAFPILLCEVPQATVLSADTPMLQCMLIHRLQSGFLLTMVSPWPAGDSLLSDLEHLLSSFFPPLSVPSAVSFCSHLLPQWCFLTFLQSIFPKPPPPWWPDPAVPWSGWPGDGNFL